ncbi:MAG TPA: hypothetical protein DCW46_10540 [Desulfotomaculum sp.]|nr:MAG: Glycosyltransferase [Parcubacteria bacterium 33_209]HAU32666.1 hypothetical protein [Desulfotomaculum sp.]
MTSNEQTINTKPLISVIIPTYNRAHLITRAINSVLIQTYQNFELLIIDDGSIDNTESIVKSIKDPRIFYYKEKENKGVLSALNRGFELIKGEYVCSVDSDDEILPDALQIAVEKLINLSPLGVGFLRFDCIDAESKKLSGSGISREGFVPYEDCLCEKIQGDHWFILASELIKGQRFNEKLYAGEIILWLKLHKMTKVYYVPRVLCKTYRRHGERICNPSILTLKKNIPNIALTREVFLQEFGEQLKLCCPINYAKRLAGMGFWQIINGKSAGIIALCKSLKYHFSIKTFFVLLFSPFLFSKRIAIFTAHKYFEFQNK